MIAAKTYLSHAARHVSHSAASSRYMRFREACRHCITCMQRSGTAAGAIMSEQLPAQQTLMLPLRLIQASSTRRRAAGRAGPNGCVRCAGAAGSAGKRGAGPRCAHAAVAGRAHQRACAAHARFPHGHLLHGESPSAYPIHVHIDTYSVIHHWPSSCPHPCGHLNMVS